LATTPSPLTRLTVPQKPRTAPIPGQQPFTRQQNIDFLTSGLGPGQAQQPQRGTTFSGTTALGGLAGTPAAGLGGVFGGLGPGQRQPQQLPQSAGITSSPDTRTQDQINAPALALAQDPNSPFFGFELRPNANGVMQLQPPLAQPSPSPPPSPVVPPAAPPVPAGTEQPPAPPFEQFNNPDFPQGPGFPDLLQEGGGAGNLPDLGFDRGSISDQLRQIPGLQEALRTGGIPAVRDLINNSLAGGALGTDLNSRLTTSLSDRLTRSPDSGFTDLPFSDQLSDIISQFGGGLGGPIQGQGEIGQLLSQLSGGNLPRSFQGQLEGLVGSLGEAGTNPFGPGLTGEEAEAQRGILDTTLERARERAFTDIKADAARRGLTSADAPSQERLARLDEELARQSGTLANQQLLQDFDLRRSSGQLGLQRQQTLGDLIGGTRAEDLGLADLLGRVGLGAGGQDKQFQLESLEGLGGLIGPERGLQAQQQSNLIDQISRLILGQQGAALSQEGIEVDADLQQQAINRLDQGDLGVFLNQLFSGGGGNTGGGGGGGFNVGINLPDIFGGGGFGGGTPPFNGVFPSGGFSPFDVFNPDPNNPFFTPPFNPNQNPFDASSGNFGGGRRRFPGDRSSFDNSNPFLF